MSDVYLEKNTSCANIDDDIFDVDSERRREMFANILQTNLVVFFQRPPDLYGNDDRV
jgi:hypothetical protein